MILVTLNGINKMEWSNKPKWKNDCKIENWHGDQLKLEVMRAFTFFKNEIKMEWSNKPKWKNDCKIENWHGDQLKEVEFKSSNSPQKFSIL